MTSVLKFMFLESAIVYMDAIGDPSPLVSKEASEPQE